MSLGLPPGRYEYNDVIDGNWCIDPYCSEWVPNQAGSLNRVLRVPAAGARTDSKRKKL